MSNIVTIIIGLGPEVREISYVIRARTTTISYEKLFEKLLDCELFLCHGDAKKLSSRMTIEIGTPTKSNNNNCNNYRKTNNSQHIHQTHIQILRRNDSSTQIQTVLLFVK